MSEFLVLKSTEEQLNEGQDLLIDSARVEDRNGLPVLKMVFDVHHFREDEVQVFIILQRLRFEICLLFVDNQLCCSQQQTTTMF